MQYDIVRIGSESEISMLAALAREIWNQHFVPIIGQSQVDYMLKKYQSEQAITKQISEGMQYCLVKDGSENVAYCGFKKDGERLFLSKLYVRHDYRRKGLSKIMLKAAEDYAAENRLRAVYLTVNKHNDDTIAIYKHLGFETIDSVVTDIGNGFVMDDYIMQYEY